MREDLNYFSHLQVAFFKYIKTFGALPEFEEVFEDKPVGRYRWRLNSLYLSSKIDKSLQAKLDQTSIWIVVDDLWYEKFEEIEYSLANNQDFDIEWLELQSEKLFKYSLSPQKIELLNSLSIDWRSTSNSKIDGNQLRIIFNWLSRVESFSKFYKTYGLPTLKHKGKEESGIDLKNWIDSQRLKYKKDLLNKEQVDILDDISTDWRTSEVEKSFHRKVNFLKKHFQEKKCYPDSDNWIIDMRSLKRNGKLPLWKKDLLSALPEWSWNPREDNWNKGYELTKDYLIHHKELPIGRGIYWKGIDVSSWIISNRARYLNAFSSKEKRKAALLEELPNWSWDTSEEKWEKKYITLKEYVLTNHRYPIPKEKFQNLSIGSWVDTQRSYFRKNILPNEKIMLLEELPNWSWNPLKDSWLKKYKDLRAGILTKEIRSWVRKQRSKYKKNKLSPDRIMLLEELNNWHWY